MPDQANARRALYDLHLHTWWSYDAMTTAEELISAAARRGVRHVAITDHHVVDGLSETTAAAALFREVQVVRAAELTVTTSIGSVDVVCLGITPAAVSTLQPVWDAYHDWQREYGAATSAGVRALGYDYSDEQRQELLASYRPPAALAVQGATHVANKMQREWFIKRGFIESEEEYGPFLRAAAEHVPLPRYPAAEFVLPKVKQQGALLVIAHPTGYFQRDDRKRMELLREELLLDGVECAHRTVPAELTPLYRAWCEEHDLLSSGGSDLHWHEDVDERIGLHAGADEWWTEIEERLPEGAIAEV